MDETLRDFLDLFSEEYPSLDISSGSDSLTIRLPSDRKTQQEIADDVEYFLALLDYEPIRSGLKPNNYPRKFVGPDDVSTLLVRWQPSPPEIVMSRGQPRSPHSPPPWHVRRLPPLEPE